MTRYCDGYTCNEYRIRIIVGKRIYQNGVKYCKVCDSFLGIESYRCPCCKSIVRTKSHSKKWREKISYGLLQ